MKTREPAPPPGLSPEAKETWREIVSGWRLDASRLFLLARALEAFDRMQAARKVVADQGMLLTGPRGAVSAHPLLKTEHDARNAMLSAWKALGLDMEPPGAIGRPPGR